MDDDYRINQAINPNSDLKPINNLVDIGKSICKIIFQDRIGTGFLIKLNILNKSFYFLMTCEHVISQDVISNKTNVKITYDNQHQALDIKLDKNERYIQDFLYLGIDATIVEILKQDKIPEGFFLLPNLEYLNGYDIFKNQKIYIFQFPQGGNLSYSEGSIQEVNIYKNEIIHVASTLEGSSGSPIIICGSNLVLGIHKQGNPKLKVNYGNFIGPIIKALQKNNKIEKLFLANGIYEGEIAKNKMKEGNGRINFNNGEIYIGQFKNDLMDGKGVLYYKINIVKYEGDFLEGKYHGKGKLFQKNREYYIGQFIKGKKNGFGKEYYSDNKLKYEGEFKDDYYNGEGKYILSKGEYYIGNWRNGRKCFQGIIFDEFDKVLCEGIFEDDDLIKGKIYYENGNYYSGEIKNLEMNGYGTLYYKNGKIKYDGYFVNNKIEGEGVYYKEDGSYYLGNFKNGKKHGKGAIYDKDNNVLYEGTFENDKIEGKGRVVLDNGDIYEGDFKNGKMEGNGIILDKNNEIIFKGEFIDNHKKEGYINIDCFSLKLTTEVINNINQDINKISDFNNDKKIKNNLEGKIRMDEEQKNFKGYLQINENDLKHSGVECVFGVKIENELSLEGQGELINEKFFGKAKLFDGKNQLVYDGDYVNDKEEGNGTKVYKNGLCYIGEFKNGKREGKGILFDKNHNIIYEGEFKNDTSYGKGKLYKNNEIIYEGDFINGRVEGKGKMKLENGFYYIGELKNYQMNGQGKIYGINDNLVAEGIFINGKLEGKGKNIFSDNSYYIGEFKNGLFHGKGKKFKRNQTLEYEGDFVNGKYEGNGQLVYDNGDIYIGEFKGGKEKGKGILLNKDSKILYEGEFDGEMGIGFYAKMALYKVKNLFG